MRKSIRFLRNGHVVELDNVPPDLTLLDYLRLTERATGTKDGCGEGECGACTVAVGRFRDGELVYEPVTACTCLVGQLDAADIVTVEDVAAADGTLHPVQAALVEKHASQCGFCTPGMVMSLLTLYRSSKGPVERRTVEAWLAGNLCRCTGYRSTVDAGLAACARPRPDSDAEARLDTAGILGFLTDEEDILVGDDDSFFAAPRSVDALAALYEAHADAILVAGGADVGAGIARRGLPAARLIHLGRVEGLDRIEDTGREILIGASATFVAAEPFLRRIDPDLAILAQRIGGRQVRSSATLCGNVAAGSPDADMPPALIALGAMLELRRGSHSRVIPVEDFFVAEGVQDREPGEFITGLMIPKLTTGQVFRAYKVARRFEQDRAIVTGAFRLTIDDSQTFVDARIAYGGMAETPRRAMAAEAILIGGRARDSRVWAEAFAALRSDFSPEDDHRASARYRNETAQALLGKALIEIAGTTDRRTRVAFYREAVADAAP